MTYPPPQDPANQPTPYNPGNPVPPPQPYSQAAGHPSVAPNKRNRLLLSLAAAGATVLLIGVTVGVTLAATGRDKTAEPATQNTWDGGQQNIAEDPTLDEGEILPDPTTPAPAVTPKVSDFTLKPKIFDRECFGSAGCNVQFRIDMTYGGAPLDDSTTWLVTYEVTGIEDGPMIGSLELTGDTFSASEELVQTKSSKSKIAIKVTEVDKVGI